ncbi:MAG: Ppx/GppA family phosphatase [Bacillota bacterium]
MKKAAIDIGTNSMRLLLCELKNGRLTNKKKYMNVTRIGEGVSKSFMLSEEAIMRNLEVFSSYCRIAHAYGADNIVAIATSAVRDAKNRDVFLEKAYNSTGVQIRTISGTEEAELGISGVISGLDYVDENILVIDIGGGSTELILYGSSGVEFSESVDAGAVRMTEMCIKEHPVRRSSVECLGEKLKERFCGSIETLKNKKINKAVAIGGTAITLAAMYNKADVYDTSLIHNTSISKEYLAYTFDLLAGMKVEERFRITGLQRERADVITAGIYILRFIMDALGIDNVKISDNDNMEGALLKY